MHALALKTIKQNWNDAWFETWDLFWLGGKGKGKNRNGKMGMGKGKAGDDGRADYEDQLKAERVIRNQNWEEKMQRWEQGSSGEKGFGKGEKREERVKTGTSSTSPARSQAAKTKHSLLRSHGSP